MHPTFTRRGFPRAGACLAAANAASGPSPTLSLAGCTSSNDETANENGGKVFQEDRYLDKIDRHTRPLAKHESAAILMNFAPPFEDYYRFGIFQ